MYGEYFKLSKMSSLAGKAHFSSLSCSFRVDVCADKRMSSTRSQSQGNLAADAAACQAGDEHPISFDTVKEPRVSQLCQRVVGET